MPTRVGMTRVGMVMPRRTPMMPPLLLAVAVAAVALVGHLHGAAAFVVVGAAGFLGVL